MTSDKSLLLLRSSESPTLIPTDLKRMVNIINYFNLRSYVSCIYNMYYCCLIKYSCRRFPRRYIILCHVFNLYSSSRRYRQSKPSLLVHFSNFKHLHFRKNHTYVVLKCNLT